MSQDMPRGDMQDADDETLAVRVAEGDRRAFTALVERHLNPALRIAGRMTGNRAEAEDAVQSAYLKLWQSAGLFDANRAKFSSWFFRIVANSAIDLGRKRRDQPLPDNYDAPDLAADAERLGQDCERRRVLLRALNGLPDRQRLAVTLCYFEDWSNAEAAEVLEVGVKGLESLLVRARRALRAALGDIKDDLL